MGGGEVIEAICVTATSLNNGYLSLFWKMESEMDESASLKYKLKINFNFKGLKGDDWFWFVWKVSVKSFSSLVSS